MQMFYLADGSDGLSEELVQKLANSLGSDEVRLFPVGSSLYNYCTYSNENRS